MTAEEIRKQAKNCPDKELPAFIAAYEDDQRSSVQAVVKSAAQRFQKYEAELARTFQMSVYERKYRETCPLIAGIDEVGRGPLAGPVVACAVILDPDKEILYLNDSKQLTAAKREQLYEEIMEKAIAVGLGSADNHRIDEINILQATYEAMREAIQNLSEKPDILLNDAVTIPDVAIRQVPIIKGDAKSISIAAASIVAKVTRDRLMVKYDAQYPEYGFRQNKGYGAAKHIEAIKQFGPTPLHRKSFIGNFV
ncbi:MAG: ribonuclease HII [Lachnospiraceae bacterium]|nr:ribonuclease HII [Lachnospiraceae bacterium]